MPGERPTSLAKSYLRRSLSGILVSILCIGSFWVISSYRHIDSSREILKSQAVEEQMQRQKERVDFALNLIINEQQQFNDNLTEDLRARTLEAHQLIENIYNETKNDYPREEIVDLIKTALRGIRFNDGRGYYFATSLDGYLQIYPPDPEREGTSLADQVNSGGQFVTREIIELIRRQGEGLYRYSWPKPGIPGREFEKVSYVKYFAPLDWYIGTGEYLEDVTAVLQKRVVEQIETIRFADGGYFFMATFDGVALTYPAKGRNMYEVVDENGVKIVQELIGVARSGGGYVQYTMPPLENEQSQPKISYASAVPQWNWYIGTGDAVADLNDEVAQLLSQRKSELLGKIVLIICFLAVLLLLWIYFTHRLSQNLSAELAKLQSYFDRSAREAVALDPAEQKFVELRQLAESASHMLAERQKVETILAAQENRFRTLFEHVPDYALVLRRDGDVAIIDDLSEAACTIHGYKKEELIGKPISFLDPEHNDSAISAVRFNSLRTGMTARFKATHRRKDGSTFPIEALLRKISIDGQEYYLAVERDLSEIKAFEDHQRELELQLQQKFKMEAVGMIAGGIAHNFNNNLAIILGNLEMSRLRINDPAALDPLLENAQIATLRSRDLVNQILCYSRKGGEAKRQVSSIAVIVDETVRLLSSTCPATVQMHYLPPDNAADLNIEADASQIQEILINLFANAVHAMDEVGEITIGLQCVNLAARDLSGLKQHRPGRYARLSVRDNGCGMSPEIQEKIFDPFFTTKEEDKGTGMGLATVQGIVTRHNGFIRVDSIPGEGTEFQLFFPIVAGAEQDAGQSDAEFFQGDERVLLVDDNETLLEIGQEMLKELGYQVDTAASGAEAMEMLTLFPERYDLVITDQTMAGMTGLELAKQIQESGWKLPVILCSGYSSKVADGTEGLANIACFCQKPFRLSELAQIIRATLKQDQE